MTEQSLIDQLAAVARDVRLEVLAEHRRPIGIIGAGAIVDLAHLPAYVRAGLEVVAVTDLDQARAHDVARRHGVPVVHASAADLLADGRIEVVDVAVPGVAQPRLVRQALATGHHVLAQKPFAPTVDEASALVELADQCSLVLGVNQQLRYDEGVAAAHAMVDRGWIGELTSLTVDVDIWTEWRDWPWMLTTDRLEIVNHSIHYHDLVRWFLGEPTTVFCATGRTPGQAPSGETRTISTYLFASGARALVASHHENDHGDGRATFRIDGSHGAIRGTFGLLYAYPSGRPDTLEIHSRVLGTDGWVPYPVTRRWIPDAFLGTMGSVLAAAAGGAAPR